MLIEVDRRGVCRPDLKILIRRINGAACKNRDQRRAAKKKVASHHQLFLKSKVTARR
jgi:hypothetical protein